MTDLDKTERLRLAAELLNRGPGKEQHVVATTEDEDGRPVIRMVWSAASPYPGEVWICDGMTGRRIRIEAPDED